MYEIRKNNSNQVCHALVKCAKFLKIFAVQFLLDKILTKYQGKSIVLLTHEVVQKYTSYFVAKIQQSAAFWSVHTVILPD